MVDSKLFVVDEGRGNGFVINEYNNRFFLVSAKPKGTGEGFYKLWCFPSINKKASGNPIPMQVEIGGLSVAIMACVEIIMYLLEKLPIPDRNSIIDKILRVISPNGDTIPF